ncbi:hypothetical protein KMZ32_01910 [Phycicoccus sp. MAQZ13P-2]|uniref:hypothetical protein n=1 Tax=Phycicoccus mangrovi TaxID=2840470 RepID=UPI001C007CFE|nr:hypothetical protein [Phycicoccus mangrovi]MBT9254448.1 hypothetical protein [Phycicoccus mangrovi]MBT9272826.1 hypothetical protein [Phycicoccus mangrovi]
MSPVDDLIAHLAGVVEALLDPSEVTRLLEATGTPSHHRAGHAAVSIDLLAELRQTLLACTPEELDTVQVAVRLCVVTPANVQEALVMAAVVLRPPQ